MAQSKCPSCPSTEFELAKGTPKNSKQDVVFVQCAQCGSVISAFDQIRSAVLHDKIIGFLSVIDQKLIALQLK